MGPNAYRNGGAKRYDLARSNKTNNIINTHLIPLYFYTIAKNEGLQIP